MIKIFVICASLLLATISNGNNLKYFIPLEKADALIILQKDLIKINVIFVYTKQINGELIKGSAKVTYRIQIDSINGEYFWKQMTESYVESIDKWTCNIPYFMSTCAPKQAIFIQFGRGGETSGEAAETMVSDIDLDNGFFILKDQKNTYRYNLSNRGINGIRDFFHVILSGLPDTVGKSCK
jgi:hypothetical protein